MQLYGTFEEKGYAFRAFIPDQDGDPIAFELRISIGDELKYTLWARMVHVPVFGVDVDDGRFLESVLDRVLALLPPAGEFNPTTVAALDALEVEAGGKAAREEHARRSKEAAEQPGAFGYVGGLFAQRFAELLGGRQAMDKWMETKQPALGDRTPAQALRLGMVPEVLKLLLSNP